MLGYRYNREKDCIYREKKRTEDGDSKLLEPSSRDGG